MRTALRGIAPAISLAVLALPATAQQIVPQPSSAYPHAVAAGYKALTLCEGIFTAGRTEQQIAAVESRGIYSEYEAIVSRLNATIDRQRRTVSVPFAADLPPRRADWAARTGCTLAPIGQATGPARPVQHAGAIGPAPADFRPWPMGDRGIAPRPSPVTNT